MWNKIKSIALAVAIVAVGILAVVLRRNSDGSGVADDSERIGEIQDGLESLGDSQQRIEAGLDNLEQHNQDAQGRSEDISGYNQSAQTGIQSAIDILKKAKERTDAQRS